jgi:probable rRNA maturation factor
VSVEVVNESGVAVDERLLVDLARFVLTALDVHPRAEVGLTCVGPDEMARLHQEWMDLPGPTDVMAFPMDELTPGASGDDPTTGEPSMLGDVVLCPQVAAEQAREAGHSAEDEMHLLTTHGLLHLLGYDHADPAEEAEMFALQARLLTAWRAARGRTGRLRLPGVGGLRRSHDHGAAHAAGDVPDQPGGTT